MSVSLLLEVDQILLMQVESQFVLVELAYHVCLPNFHLLSVHAIVLSQLFVVIQEYSLAWWQAIIVSF